MIACFSSLPSMPICSNAALTESLALSALFSVVSMELIAVAATSGALPNAIKLLASPLAASALSPKSLALPAIRPRAFTILFAVAAELFEI